MSKYVYLRDYIKSISVTHKFDKSELIFLNTSDVLEGKILINHYSPVSELKGQAKKTIQNFDILYSEIRPKNKRYAYVKNIENIVDYVVSTKLMVLRNVSTQLNTDYLYHYLTSDYTIKYLQNRAENRIGSFPQITFEILSSCQIRLPDLETQKNIASILNALDRKIEVNNKINDNLEALAKTIYDYWFVQFDFPDENGKPYKSSEGKMVYNKVLKRKIPDGWEVKVFNEWIKEIKVGDWGKENSEGNYTERVYCIRGADINGLNGNGEIKAPERFILKNNLSKILKPNDFVIEISGGSPTQSTARITHLSDKVFKRFDTNIICSNFCKAFSLVNEKYVYNFKQEWQRLYDANVFFGFEGKTSGIKNFLFDSFVNSYSVVLPPTELVEEYHNTAKSIENKKQKNLLQNQRLTQLRDWLLPMLMNGQVSVK